MPTPSHINTNLDIHLHICMYVCRHVYVYIHLFVQMDGREEVIRTPRIGWSGAWEETPTAETRSWADSLIEARGV